MNASTNNSRHKFVVGLALIAVLLFVMFFSKGLTLDSKTVVSPLVGKAAKEFHVSLLQGSEALVGHHVESIDLADLKGAPVIINFWASWCSSCAEEAKALEAFWKAHGLELKILGIAVHDRAEDVQVSVKSHGKTYAIGFDEEGRVALNYGVTGVPETVFINAQGLVIHKEVGPVNAQLLEKLLTQLKASSI